MGARDTRETMRPSMFRLRDQDIKALDRIAERVNEGEQRKTMSNRSRVIRRLIHLADNNHDVVAQLIDLKSID